MGVAGNTVSTFKSLTHKNFETRRVEELGYVNAVYPLDIAQHLYGIKLLNCVQLYTYNIGVDLTNIFQIATKSHVVHAVLEYFAVSLRSSIENVSLSQKKK